MTVNSFSDALNFTIEFQQAQKKRKFKKKGPFGLGGTHYGSLFCTPRQPESFYVYIFILKNILHAYYTFRKKDLLIYTHVTYSYLEELGFI